MGRNILILQGHPDPEPVHFCHALAESYRAGAAGSGHTVTVLDIARLDFPLLRTKSQFDQDAPPPSLVSAQAAIKAADHLVIIYPLWLGMLPALFKGFLEQVLRPGFAMDLGDGTRFPKKLLNGKSARIMVTMGMPGLAYRHFYGAHSLKALTRNILKTCGISPVRSSVFGMVETVNQTTRDAWLAQAKSQGAQAR